MNRFRSSSGIAALPLLAGALFWGFKEKASQQSCSCEKGGRVSPTRVYNNYLSTLLVHDVLTRMCAQYYVVLTYYSVPALLPQAKKSWVGTYIYS